MWAKQVGQTLNQYGSAFAKDAGIKLNSKEPQISQEAAWELHRVSEGKEHRSQEAPLSSPCPLTSCQRVWPKRKLHG